MAFWHAGGSSITRLFILGYYGFGNWGDELSLLATLSALERIGEKFHQSFSYRVLSKERKFSLPLPG
ncbi:MAG: hypothetical protein ACUVRN_04960, partial [Candidatus Caldatribacteriaceae bacterium]